jgi:hypothetical protein
MAAQAGTPPQRYDTDIAEVARNAPNIHTVGFRHVALVGAPRCDALGRMFGGRFVEGSMTLLEIIRL